MMVAINEAKYTIIRMKTKNEVGYFERTLTTHDLRIIIEKAFQASCRHMVRDCFLKKNASILFDVEIHCDFMKPP